MKLLENLFNKRDRNFVIVALIGSLLQFGIFKYFYPFANYIHGDSFVYLNMAYVNPKVGTYPIGYPMFLRLFSVFSKSDSHLVWFQYLLLQYAILFFLLNFFNKCNPTNLTKWLLFVIMIFNPVSWFLSNYISSDAIFLSLSVIWFTQLMVIIDRPTYPAVVYNGILLAVLFTIRYNALYYPVLSLVAIFINKGGFLKKIMGVFISIVLIFLFITYTSNDFYRLSGARQFSPFSGWQLANNALYAYRYVDSTHLRKLPKKFGTIDKMVRDYFDSTRDVKKHPSEKLVASTVYMWSENSPLSIYAASLIKDSAAGPLKKWSTAAPMMREYGWELIKMYPGEFIDHYIIPNCIKYYTPPIEFLGVYNARTDTVNEMANVWFNYRNNKIYNRVRSYDVTMLNYFPIFVAVMNVLLVLSIVSFFILKFNRVVENLCQLIVLVFALWIFNFSFSVFASPIALRFQLFPIIISMALAFMLIEILVRGAFDRDFLPRNDMVSTTSIVIQ